MSAFKMNNQHTRAHLVQSAQQLHKNRSMSQTKAVEYRPLSSMYSSKLLEISLTGDMQKYNNVPGRHPLLLLPEDNQQGYVPNKLLLYVSHHSFNSYIETCTDCLFSYYFIVSWSRG